MSRYYLVAIALFITYALPAQSFWFGPKVGPSIGLQKWNQFDQDPLFAFHGALFIESHDPDSPGSVYAQLGYHTRGSAIRVININNSVTFSNSFKFNNLSLSLGAKRRLGSSGKFRPYYHLGVRLEYTLNTNLKEYERFGSPIYPIELFVHKFNYGVNIGGGFETKFSDLIGGSIEITVSPDFSKQYEQPAIPNVIVPWNNQSVTISARDIRNISLEISLALRFLRKVEYY